MTRVFLRTTLESLLCWLIRSNCKAVGRSMSSSQRMFQQKLDPLTGKTEWVVIDEEEEDDDQVNKSPKVLLLTTSYLDMLNDTPRNRAYCQAIQKTITKPCHVLDIGAGTGLLSMMAARAMISGDEKNYSDAKGVVSACESYLPMFKLLRKVLHVNGLGKDINIVNKRSDELKVGTDLSSHADVLVSEILDSELLGEGVIPTLQDAHERLLVTNPRTIPYRATTFGQLVESKFLWRLHDLHNHEAQALDGVHLTPDGLETVISVKPQQYPMHCDAISEEIKLLSEPFKIFEFDFWKRPDNRGEAAMQINIICDGQVHAVISWWVLQLDYEGTILYSTAPRWISSTCNPKELQSQVSNWCDHWKQCVWFVPGRGMAVSKDKQVYLHAVHDDTSISYNLTYDNQRTEPVNNDLYSRACLLTLSPERIAVYGDREWRFAMITALRNALQGKVSSLCLVADDSVFLTVLIAHLSRTSNIISIFPGIQEKGSRYLQAICDANGFSMDRMKVLSKRRTCVTMEDTNQKMVDILVGEPFYYGTDGMLPWQNLRFWKERSILGSVLSEDVIIMPCKGILRACAMSLPDLWRSRCYLTKIEGFDHSIVNATLGACGNADASHEGPCLPYFIWQCGDVKELSKAFTVMEFDFSKPISPCFGKIKMPFTASGICHGFALWIDWVLDAENTIVLPTGPDHRYYKQGVKLLSKPVAVGAHGSCSADECSATELEAAFDPSNGEVSVKHLFL